MSTRPPRPRAPRWPAPAAPVVVVAPAGPAPEEELAAGLAVLDLLAGGRAVLCDPAVRARTGHLAGPDLERAAGLARALTDPDAGLVMASRGGFGSSRLLGLVDWPSAVAARPCLLGFSDLTALHLALAAHGLVGLHGPVVTQLPRLDAASRGDLAALLAGRPAWPARLIGEPLTPGRAAGPLLGGNLTLLCHLAGTPWLPDLSGAVLFIEDTGEPPYRLDRLLTQLALAGVLDAVAGVAVGALSARAADPPERRALVAERLAVLGRPVVMGLPFGHGPANRLLPVGALAELDGDAGELIVGVDLA